MAPRSPVHNFLAQCAPIIAIVSQDARDEVCHKCGTETATALLRALEATVSLTPQCLTKILSVLEGSTVTEPAASKMRKALSKSFIARKRSKSSSLSSG